MSKTTRVPISLCVNCGKRNDTASSPAYYVPSPGDISICLYCGHLTAFDDELRLRPLTDDEMIEVSNDPEVKAMQRARASLHQFKQGGRE